MKTYALIKDDGGFCISGTVDGADAALLGIFFILETERGEYPIYDGTYGISRRGLLGERVPYAVSMIKRQITEEVEKRYGDTFAVSSVCPVFSNGRLQLTVRLTAKESNETQTEVFYV